MPHRFHIPVMGTCFTTDTPLRVAHLGIDSAISLVDDKLLERIGSCYAEKFAFPYEKVSPSADHARAERIRRYLNLVNILVEKNFKRAKTSPFTGNSDKDRYFLLLPTNDPLRIRYLRMMESTGSERSAEENALTREMRPGAIDVNIMVKLDRPGYDDAKEALRGYAESELRGNTGVILSAGINQALFSAMETFPCFYRNENGGFDKKIKIKISDFRSALIQGKFLSRKGLEVSEYRIESGLNCGGHLFPSDGELLPTILEEFHAKRESLCVQFRSAVEKYYRGHGLDVSRLRAFAPKFTVQGGIGNFGESERFLKTYGMDGCGWGSPFLLVPEATLVDDSTRKLLAEAGPAEITISGASPLGVPFSNLKTCAAERARVESIRQGIPGTPCVKGFLQNNTEFTERPICTASREYQIRKLRQIDALSVSDAEKSRLKNSVLEKTCICHQLGNSALLALGLESEKDAPPSICPGPNIAYFGRNYTLAEMVDFIYGRKTPDNADTRPHVFALEILLYAKWSQSERERSEKNPEEKEKLVAIARNLKAGMEKSLEMANGESFPGENLESIRAAVSKALPLIEDFLKEAD